MPALAHSRDPARRAIGFVLRPACAATLHSPAGGAAAAPATGGGAKVRLGGGEPRGRESPAPPVAPPCPHRLSLLAAVLQVAVVRPEFVALSVGHLLELPQQSALL